MRISFWLLNARMCSDNARFGPMTDCPVELFQRFETGLDVKSIEPRTTHYACMTSYVGIKIFQKMQLNNLALVSAYLWNLSLTYSWRETKFLIQRECSTVTWITIYGLAVSTMVNGDKVAKNSVILLNRFSVFWYTDRKMFWWQIL